jgi:hypothetical protein
MYLFEFIRVDGGATFMDHFKGDASCKSLGSSELEVDTHLQNSQFEHLLHSPITAHRLVLTQIGKAHIYSIVYETMFYHK